MISITRAGVASISTEPSVCSAIRCPSLLRSADLFGHVEGEPPPGLLEMADVHQLRVPDPPAPEERLMNMAEQRVPRFVLLHVGDEPDRPRFELLGHHVVGVPGDTRWHVRADDVHRPNPVELGVVLTVRDLSRYGQGR